MNQTEQKALQSLLVKRDAAGFSNVAYEPRKVSKPWGYEIHFTPDNLPYMGKILHINAGAQLSLQVHDKKQESWYKLSGDAILKIENADGELEEIPMQDGIGYTCQLTQKHRLKAGQTDCEIVEVSTPEIGTTYRLEDDYKRPSETEELRRQPGRGWKS